MNFQVGLAIAGHRWPHADIGNAGPRLAIDIGMARGLTAASPDWSLFSGFVVPLGKLW